ncbi:MAG: aldehyde dehydrogenase family protein, partial [Pseudomonadota bacterium]
FNHPLNLIVHQVAPAIAVGCPVIIKPAEDTPLSCFRFVQILYESGLPEEWCQALTVNNTEVATELVTDERVNFLSFIGSASVGWMLRSKLAPGTRCSLEHGGVAPVIITEDTDIDYTLPLLGKGAFYHAGQVCVSVQRIYCHQSIADKVADGLTDYANAAVIGDPVLPETEIGPLIRPREVDRIEEWVNAAINEGAKLLCGGKRISESCYEATVLYDPHDNSTVSQKEIFGPVAIIYPYENLDDAIARANAVPYAFQAAVFGKNIDTLMHAAKHLDASAVMLNDHTAFRVDWMPFAGLKQSGLGVGGIPYTMEDMQIDKLYVLRSHA